MTKKTKARVRVDSKLVHEAMTLGGERSASAVATIALREYVARRDRCRLFEWIGRVDYFDEYDHKAARMPKSER